MDKRISVGLLTLVIILLSTAARSQVSSSYRPAGLKPSDFSLWLDGKQNSSITVVYSRIIDIARPANSGAVTVTSNSAFDVGLSQTPTTPKSLVSGDRIIFAENGTDTIINPGIFPVVASTGTTPSPGFRTSFSTSPSDSRVGRFLAITQSHQLQVTSSSGNQIVLNYGWPNIPAGAVIALVSAASGTQDYYTSAALPSGAIIREVQSVSSNGKTINLTSSPGLDVSNYFVYIAKVSGWSDLSGNSMNATTTINTAQEGYTILPFYMPSKGVYFSAPYYTGGASPRYSQANFMNLPNLGAVSLSPRGLWGLAKIQFAKDGFDFSNAGGINRFVIGGTNSIGSTSEYGLFVNEFSSTTFTNTFRGGSLNTLSFSNPTASFISYHNFIPTNVIPVATQNPPPRTSTDSAYSSFNAKSLLSSALGGTPVGTYGSQTASWLMGGIPNNYSGVNTHVLSPFNGHIQEIIFGRGSLNRGTIPGSRLLLLQAYSAWRWSNVDTLGNTHPFYMASPPSTHTNAFVGIHRSSVDSVSGTTTDNGLDIQRGTYLQNEGDWMFAVDNAQGAASFSVSNGINILNRSWFIRRGHTTSPASDANVILSFNFSSLGLGTPNNSQGYYRIHYNSTNAVFNGTTRRSYLGTVSGNFIRFTVPLADIQQAGGYLTLENEVPFISIASPNLTVCSGTANVTFNYTGATTNTQNYRIAWSSDLTNVNSTALSSLPNGTIGISSIPNNNTTSFRTITGTVFPINTTIGSGVEGIPTEISISIAPLPVVGTLTNILTCNNVQVSPAGFTGTVSGTLFDWTNSNTSIGLGVSGTGNLTAFTATNVALSNNISSTISVTPKISVPAVAGGFCSGLTQTLVVTVLPSPILSSSITPIGECSNITFTGYTPSSSFSETVTYNWERLTLPSGITSNSLSTTGAGSVPSQQFVNSSTTLTRNVVFRYSLTSASCTVPSVQDVTIPVYPRPVSPTISNSLYGTATVIASPICEGAPIGTLTIGNLVTGKLLWQTIASGTTTPRNIGFSGTDQSVDITNGTTSYTITGTTALATDKARTSYRINLYNTVLYTDGSVSKTCSSTVAVQVYTINYTPDISTSLPSGTIGCSNAPLTVLISNTDAGISESNMAYTWSRPSVVNISNAAASANISSISETLINTSNIAVTVPITITATSTTSTCSSTLSYNVIVNPIPVLTSATSYISTPATLKICNKTALVYTATANLSGTSFSWVRPSVSGIIGTSSGTGASINETLENNAVSGIPVDLNYNFQLNNTNGCSNTQAVTVRVNPTATVNAVANLTLCNNIPTTSIVFSGTASGTDAFSWSMPSPNNINFPALTGTGSIQPFTPTNTTTSLITKTISVTPRYESCVGTSTSFTISVNPTPQLTGTLTSKICSGGNFSFTPSHNLTGITVNYNWSRVLPSGVTASGAISGTGSIPAQALTNSSGDEKDVVYTYVLGTTSCASMSTYSVTATVYPRAQVVAPSNIEQCNGIFISNINLSASNITDQNKVKYNWTAVNGTDIGLPSNSANDISQIAGFTATLSGVTNTAVTRTISVVGYYANVGDAPANYCYGTSASFDIKINPAATVNTISSTFLCPNENSPVINFSTPLSGVTVVYDWVASTNTIGFSSMSQTGVSSFPSFTALNSSNAAAVTSQITVTPRITSGSIPSGCAGSPRTFNITVNPLPEVTQIPDIIPCNGTTLTPISFTSSVTDLGVVSYNWRNSLNVVGFATLTGTGSIPGFTADNSTNDIRAARYHVSASYTNSNDLNASPKTCTNGSEMQFLIRVIPTPNLTTPVIQQVLCSGGATTAVNLTGTVVSTQFKWVQTSAYETLKGNSDTVFNATSIPSFTGINNTGDKISTSFRIIPTRTYLSVTCSGTTSTLPIVINPIPTVNTVSSLTVCQNVTVTGIQFSGNITATGIQYNWVNNQTQIGVAASGTNSIPSFTALNPTNAGVTATISVTPTFTNAGTTCTGDGKQFTILVNPTPQLTGAPAAFVCSGETVSFSPSSTTLGTNILWQRQSYSQLTNAAASSNSSISEALQLNDNVVTPFTVPYLFNLSANGCTNSVTKEVVVNPLPKLTSVTQAAVVCGGGNATISLSGLLPSSTFSITYSINGVTKPDVTGVAANGAGNASFDIPLVNTDDGRTLAVTNIRRTDLAYQCSAAFTNSNRINSLSVSKSPELSAVSQSATVCEGSQALIILSGVLPNSTSTINYSINGVDQPTLTGIVANESGAASFNRILSATDHNKTILIKNMLRTDGGANCFTSFSTGNTASLRVDATSVGGTVTGGGVTVCQGVTNTSSLTLTNNTGTVLFWQSSSDGFGTDVQTLPGSSGLTSYSATSLSATRQFRAVVQNGLCPSTASTYATINVVSQPSVTLVSTNQEVCASGVPVPVSFVVNGGTGTPTYQWYENATASNTGGTSLGTTNGARTTVFTPLTKSVAANYYYYAQVSFSGSGCNTATSNIHDVFVKRYAVANDIAVSPVNPEICAGLSTTLNASLATPGSISNPVFKWFENPALTSQAAGGVGTTFVTTSLFNNTSYFIQVSGDNICPNLANTGKVATITVASAAPEVDQPSNQIVCNGSPSNTVTFTGTIAGTTYSWIAAGASNTGIPSMSGTAIVPSFIGTNSGSDVSTLTISVTPTALSGCIGTTKTFTIRVVPSVNPGNQSVDACSGVNLSYQPLNAPTGTLFTWNQPSVAGIVGSTAGLVPGATFNQTLINTENGDLPIVYNVVPTGVGGCTGIPFDLTVNVKKIPVVNNQVATICSGETFSVNPPSALTGQSYIWSLPSVTIGNISGISAQSTKTTAIGQTLTNNGSSSGTVLYTITPYNGVCAGSNFTTTVTVKPKPVLATPTVLTVCNQVASSYVPTSNTAGTVFAWTRAAVNGITNAPANGITGISETLVNSTDNPVAVNYNYTLTADGCENTQQVIMTVNPTLRLNSAKLLATCSGTALSYNPGSYTSGTSFNWVRSFVTGVRNNANAGNGDLFEVLVNESNNPVTVRYAYTMSLGSCQNTENVDVTVNPLPSVNNVANLAVCNGATGQVSFSGSAVNGTVYNWSNNSSFIGLANSGTGNISFTAQNSGNQPLLSTVSVTPQAAGCAGPSRSFNITVHPTPVLSNVNYQTTYCSNNSINFTPQSSTTGAVITWERPQIAAIIQQAASGAGNISEQLTNISNASVNVDYLFRLSANGCTNDQTVSFVVNPTPTVSNPGDQIVCNGTVKVINFSGSSINGTTYRWNNNNSAIGLNSSGQDGIFFTAANNTDVSQIATISVTPSANGCSGQTQNFKLTVNPKLLFDPTPVSKVICSNTEFTYTPVLNSGNVTFSWERNAVSGIENTPSFGNGLIKEKLLNNTANGIQVPYIFKLTADGCTQQQTVFVTVNPKPIVDNPGDIIVCNGTVRTITFSGSQVNNTSYKWVNTNTAIGLSGTGSDAMFFNATNNTNDTVSGTITVVPVANTCEGDSKSFKIFVNPNLKLSSPISLDPICSNSVLAYTPSTSVNGTTFSWTRSVVSGIGNAATTGVGEIRESLNNTTSSPILVTYEYTLTNNGCQSKQNVIVQVNPAVSITNIGNATSICSNEDYSFAPISNVAGVQYQWVRESIAGINNQAASGSGPVNEKLINNTDAPINVVYKFTVGFANTCTNQQQMTVVVKPLPKLTSNRIVTTCTNTAVTYKPTADISGTSFVWTRLAATGLLNPSATGAGNIGEVLISSTNNPVTVDYIYQLNNINGCTKNDTIKVTVNPAPDVLFVRDESICAGNNVAPITFASNSSNVTFNWTNTDPTIGLGASGVGNIPSFTALNASSGPLVSIIQVVPEANGCKGSSVTVARITVNRPISASFIESSPLIACPSVNIGPFIAGIPLGGDGYNYAFQWQISNDNINFQNIPGETSRQLVAPPITGDRYYRMTTQSGGCSSVTQSVKVELKTNPTITLSNKDNYTVSIGNATQVFVTGGVNYLWTPASFVSNPQSASPFLSPRTDTKYTVRVTNDFGCSKDTSIQIKVVTAYQIEPNNILTPNGDGYNDLWKIKNIEFYPNNAIKIYNANGILVKDLPNYTGNWDGTVNGVKLATGTYYYQIKLKDGEAIVKGYITILN